MTNTTKKPEPPKVPLVEVMRLKGYLSAAEAARRGHCELSTIHRWADEGELAHTRVGKRLFIEASSLAAKLGPVLAAAEGLLRSQPAKPVVE